MAHDKPSDLSSLSSLSEDECARLWGLKPDGASLRVLSFMRGHDQRHLSAEQVYQGMYEAGGDKPPSLASIYRALGQLESIGLVLRHTFDGSRAVFELNHGSLHDHLVCLRCGRVDEFQSNELTTLQERIAASQGWRRQAHRLVIYGLCVDCQAKAAA